MRSTFAKGLILFVVVPYFKLVLGVALFGLGALYAGTAGIGTTLGWLKSGVQKIKPSYAPASVI